MTSNTAGHAASPQTKEQDPAWQLHSSTDSYLNWTSASNGQTALSTLLQDKYPNSSIAAHQKHAHLSPGTPLAFQGTSPMASGSTDTSSVISLHGHTISPDRAPSPSYFEKLYVQDQSRVHSAYSPTFASSGTSSDSAPDRAVMSTEGKTQPQAADPASPPMSKHAQQSSQSGAPLSPTSLARFGVGNTASKLPSPPINTQPASQRSTEPDSASKPRRPSSVFEHVGNVWERFGRKVHSTRTTDAAPSPSHRSTSQNRSSVAVGFEERPENPKAATSSPTQSDASPSQLTYLESKEQTVSPNMPSANSVNSGQLVSPGSGGRAGLGRSASRFEDDIAAELPYLAPAPRTVPAPPFNTSQPANQTHRRTSSASERVLIQVTDDNERFSVVDISGVNSADAIKERMLAKLHLFDADFSSFQLFRTEVGQSEATGHTVNDDALLVLCLQMGDDRGTLKFLIQQIAPPTNSTVRAMPPLVASSGMPRMNEASRGPSTTGSSASQRLRSGSQSSKSSVSDALGFTDSFGSSEDASNRNSGSSLTRSKAQTRRHAPTFDDARSPVQSNGVYSQTSQDRRSIGSSGDSPAHERTIRTDALRNVSSEAGLGGKAGSLTYAQQHSGTSGRRSSQTEQSRQRIDDDLNPQKLSGSSGRNQRLERSEGGNSDRSRQAVEPPFMIHNTKSMDDLRHQHEPSRPDAQVHHELQLHPAFDRDGRYPDPAILRPSTAAPSTGRDTGHGHRQYSSEAQAKPHNSVQISQTDGRILTRNRSAQAALPSGSQNNSQGSQHPLSLPQLRSPSLPIQHIAPHDPRYQRNDDPRYAPTAGYSSHTAPSRTSNSVGRPQYSAPPTYSYPNLPFQQPSRMSVPSPGYLSEFGTRAPTQAFNTYHGQDPRHMSNRQGAPPPRPHTYHDQAQPSPFVRPYAPQGLQASVFQGREDPFTTRYFPASSSRQVSEFQLQAGHLQPGMTVQETLRSKTPATQPSNAHSYAQQHPLGSIYSARDPRQVSSNQPHAHSVQTSATLPQQRLSQPQQYPQHPQSQSHHSHHQPHQQVRPSQPLHQQYQSPQSQFRQLHDRPSSMFETQGGIPQSQTSHTSMAARSSSSQQQPSHADPVTYQRRSTSRPTTSERSPNSSNGSQLSSHGRHYSAEEENRVRSSVEQTTSTSASARNSQNAATFSKGSGQAERRSYPSARDDGDLADDELAHVRPLPQPPGASKSTLTDARQSQDRAQFSSRRMSEEEDTLRAANWATLWKSLDPKSFDAMNGTAISGSSGGDGDTVRAASSTPGPLGQTDSDTVTLESRGQLQRVADSMAPEENGTVASFATFDDDDSESGTWAQPLDSRSGAFNLPQQATRDRGSFGSGDHGTLQPGIDRNALLHAGQDGNTDSPISSLRRPELRLTIDPSTGPTQLTPSSARSSGNSPLPNSARLSSGGVSRSNSFAQIDNDWAFRPPPEQLYENLDNFFPKHDLDKPLLETSAVPDGTAISSPRSETSPATLPSPASLSSSSVQQQQHLLGQRGGRHKKSIRLVAQDRKRLLDKTEKRPTSQESEPSGGLLRRRSTKLWGTKVIEMTPGQEVAAPASAVSADSPSSETSVRPVFKWVKGDLIGKGTYGRVYLALNATTGEMIAVKQVELPRTASDREDSRQKGVVAALKSEIETLKDLDHPHIVSYLGFEETSSFLSIFLEYVPGGSVGSCLRKHGKFEEQTIKSFLHQILEGLAYLHSKGILHRDLKADNILVDFEGVCKISDFGTVRRSDDIYGNVENMSLQGSIFWMAPEVVSLSKKGYSAKVDIWSLGCVVLEMFAGRRPWSDDEAVQAMFKIGAERKAPPIPADVKLSKQAAHFLKNCFEVDPAKRPTAQRLLDHVFTVTDNDWRFQQSALFRSLHR